MEHDLNTAGALGAIFELVRMLNAAIDNNELGTGDVPIVKAAFDRFDRVLGVLALRREEDRQTTLPAEEIDRLVAARQEARKRRDFARGRSHPPATAGRRHRAGGLAGGHEVETTAVRD